MNTAPSWIEALPLIVMLGAALIIGAVVFFSMLRKASVRHDLLEGAHGGGGHTPPTDAVGARSQITELVANGRKIEAIKRYRDLTGAGLKEAKDAIELGDLSALPDDPGQARPAAARQPESLDRDALGSLIRGGQKIEAIKRYREMTGVGLKEAKDAIEGWMEAPGEMPAGQPPEPGAAVDTASLDHEVRGLIDAGRSIEAVKRIRETLGLGLREAKEYVDRLH